MDDLISRQAAIDALGEEPEVWLDTDAEIAQRAQWRADKAAIEAVPTTDLSEYSDKLWKTAYERGKAEAYPKKGKWVLRPGDYICIYTCSECGAVGHRTAFCPHCGARMEE